MIPDQYPQASRPSGLQNRIPFQRNAFPKPDATTSPYTVTLRRRKNQLSNQLSIGPFATMHRPVGSGKWLASGCQIQSSLPIATAVSPMRLENPHSLSYHDRIDTKLPSITLVWSIWKIDERGSWLKSIETLWLLV